MDYRSSTSGSGPYLVDLNGSASDYSSNESQAYFYEQVKDKGGNHISSFHGLTWITAVSVSATQKSCFSDTETLSTYSNALLFETSKDNQDIIFISFRLNSYPSGSSASMILKGPDKNDTSSTTPYVSTYGTAYYGYDTTTTPLRGSIFKTGRAGKYCISTDSSAAGVNYVYVRVNGVTGGDFGDVTTGGIAVDFLSDVADFPITKDNYSGAYFALTMATTKSFVLYFRRVDSGSTITVTAYYNSTLDLTITPKELVANGTNSAINSGTPASPSS